jgi:hypothetical protein
MAPTTPRRDPDPSTEGDRDDVGGPSSVPAFDFTRLARRPWRIAFILYAIALTIGTHWPRLQLGPEVPASDKSLHVIGFGAATILLWRTGWIRSRWLVMLIVAIWSTVDEFSQGIPGLGRAVGAPDIAANMLGVLIAGSLLWATGPVGGPIYRMRYDLQGHAFDRMHVDPRSWIAYIAITLAAVLAIPVARLVIENPLITRWIIIIDALVWLHAATIIMVIRWGRHRRITGEERRCFECDEPAGDDTVFDPHEGTARCRACGATLHGAQWNDPPTPGPRIVLRAARGPAIFVMGLIALTFLVVFLAPVAYGRLIEHPEIGPYVMRFARGMGPSGNGLLVPVDLTWYALLFAVALRLYRSRLAAVFDQGVICRTCGHDLRGTPAPGGQGRCGECGEPFSRADASA